MGGAVEPLLRPIPAPVGELDSLGAGIAEVHSWPGDAILWLAGAHAAAALFHHHVLEDGVLLSMLPRQIGRRRHAREATANA